MTRAVLDHAISLTHIDRLSVIKLQNHFPSENDSVVHAIPPLSPVRDTLGLERDPVIMALLLAQISTAGRAQVHFGRIIIVTP